MAVLTAPRLTPADVLRRPDKGKGFELINGELRELNVSTKSSYIAGEAFYRIRNYLNSHPLGWAFPEGTGFVCFEDDNRMRKADTAFIRTDRLTADQFDANGYCPVCPDFVVEVVSPNDLAYDVNEKRNEWLESGAQLVWVIDPEDETVHAYRADGSVTLFRKPDTLTAEPILPGFACPVSELFRVPVAKTK
jgi:Uma2 family endonuclease